MNEHRQDVQLSRSNSNASASSSLTSLDTVVLVTPPVQPARVQELSPQPPSRAHSLPSSTSNSSGKTVSTSSSTNSHTTSSNSAISSNASSYSTSTSATSNSASYSSSHNSSSCLSISTSQSSSLSSPSSSPVSRMPRKLCGSSKRRRNSGSIAAPVRREEPAVEQSEGEGERCECCCYCSWQSVAPEPVVLVSCGSFNPITTMHLRMMGEFILLMVMIVALSLAFPVLFLGEGVVITQIIMSCALIRFSVDLLFTALWSHLALNLWVDRFGV